MYIQVAVHLVVRVPPCHVSQLILRPSQKLGECNLNIPWPLVTLCIADRRIEQGAGGCFVPEGRGHGCCSSAASCQTGGEVPYSGRKSIWESSGWSTPYDTTPMGSSFTLCQWCFVLSLLKWDHIQVLFDELYLMNLDLWYSVHK